MMSAGRTCRSEGWRSPDPDTRWSCRRRMDSSGGCWVERWCSGWRVEDRMERWCWVERWIGGCPVEDRMQRWCWVEHWIGGCPVEDRMQRWCWVEHWIGGCPVEDRMQRWCWVERWIGGCPVEDRMQRWCWVEHWIGGCPVEDRMQRWCWVGALDRWMSGGGPDAEMMLGGALALWMSGGGPEAWRSDALGSDDCVSSRKISFSVAASSLLTSPTSTVLKNTQTLSLAEAPVSHGTRRSHGFDF